MSEILCLLDNICLSINNVNASVQYGLMVNARRNQYTARNRVSRPMKALARSVHTCARNVALRNICKHPKHYFIRSNKNKNDLVLRLFLLVYFVAISARQIFGVDAITSIGVSQNFCTLFKSNAIQKKKKK